MASTSSAPKVSLKGNNQERKTVGFVNHAQDMPTHQVLQPNPMLSKKSQGRRSYGVHKNVSTNES